MREFHFYGSWDDSFAILEAILATGKATAFFPKPHPEPKVRFFDTVAPDLREVTQTGGQVHLWLPGISSLPLGFEQWDSGIYAGQYFVLGGGPYLTLSLPGCIEAPEASDSVSGKSGLFSLDAGNLSCPHEFYVSGAEIVVRMPKAAQERNEEFRKIIKAHCKRYGPKKQWVGLHAKKLLEEGKAKVGGFGFYE
jgi:hypothetical protein